MAEGGCDAANVMADLPPMSLARIVRNHEAALAPRTLTGRGFRRATMPTPIITLPIHTIEQARALAGLLRAYIDGQSPDTNDGQDWKPDPDLAGIAALYAHLDAGIAEAGKPSLTGGEKRELYRKHLDAERERWAGAHRIMGVPDPA